MELDRGSRQGGGEECSRSRLISQHGGVGYQQPLLPVLGIADSSNFHKAGIFSANLNASRLCRQFLSFSRMSFILS